MNNKSLSFQLYNPWTLNINIVKMKRQLNSRSKFVKYIVTILVVVAVGCIANLGTRYIYHTINDEVVVYESIWQFVKVVAVSLVIVLLDRKSTILKTILVALAAGIVFGL